MEEKQFNNENIHHIIHDSLELIQFNNLKAYDAVVAHCFTTRRGGVSSGECATLNLGFNRKDERENVLENYKRVARALSINYRNMVFSNQVHDNKIKNVNEEDRGKGIVSVSDIAGIDGLVTNCREVALVTFYADCVPVFFFDPTEKVIGVSHSGWRGTVKKIAAVTIQKMVSDYGCRPENIRIAIGPSIGQCCFEVGEEVYTEFAGQIPWSEIYCKKTGESKWHIDLQGIIHRTLAETGVPGANITSAGICTKCNKELFFSHRGDNGKTGSLAGIIQLR